MDTPDVAVPGLHLEYIVPEADEDIRAAAWSEVSQLDEARGLARAFRLGIGEIATATRMAQSLALVDGHAAINVGDLQAAARRQTRPQLSALARRMTPRFTRDDIVLPPEPLAQLFEIVAQARHRRLVYEEWGLGDKLTLGRGIVALFAGPSGTGKTMAAEVIAAELGLDMYKLDLSGLVSKYIGETEKNLGRVFDEAADSDAVLFFDEADAIFGKRSEVRDSHDRYANIEVGYLLQRLEEHDGIVVLATNLRANIDDAFVRRMRTVIDFPMPGEADRGRIWKRALGQAPRTTDIDLAFLSKKFRLSGGNIRNVVLLAAFLAAQDAQSISMLHLMQATKREYQKLGRLVSESEFSPSEEASPVVNDDLR
jgi:SpoVK/Ycf46/Vps4 family AAA+-type ATPase